MPLGVTLPIRKGNRGYFEMSDDILTAIKNNFINLIMTAKGERLHNPRFGCDIHKVIFEQNDDTIKDRARTVVEDAVEEWLPFLELEEFEVLTTSFDIDQYKMRLYFKYRIANAPNITDSIIVDI